MDTDQALRAAVERAIEDARHSRQDLLPKWSENRMAFLLCRHVFSVRGVREWPAKELEPYVLAFWSATRDVDDTQCEDDELRSQFNAIWDNKKMRHPSGNLLEIAKENAKGAQLHPALLQYNSTRIRYLGQVCHELAALHGDGGRFFLSQEDAGEILGRTQRAAGPILHQLCADGILVLRQRGSLLSGRASEYQWLPKS